MLSDKSKLVFATKEQATKLLTQSDEFTQRMSPFDRASRTKSEQPIDEATYLKFVGEQTLEWSAEEQQSTIKCWRLIQDRLLHLKLRLPPEVIMIKTTGLEEGAAAYTRGAAIILPRKHVTNEMKGSQTLLAHELFHVLSRHDAQLRKELYNLIGFRECAELELPAEMQKHRVTNPDAPINNQCIKIKQAGQDAWAIPVLYSTQDYDVQRGGEFFAYLTFELMLIESPDSPHKTSPQLVDGSPVLVNPKTAEGFMEQVGRNTGYILHPDEILADNFSMWVNERKSVPNPELLDKLEVACRSMDLSPGR